MWLPERGPGAGDPSGLRRVGLLDFQDATLAPVTYDIVSLLEDARRDVPPSLAERMIRRYLAARPELDETAFRAAYVALAAQRHCKVIGIFTRLCVRDGKPGYLAHIPRLWRLLERACGDPVLAPLAAWLDEAIPAAARTMPSPEPAL